MGALPSGGVHAMATNTSTPGKEEADLPVRKHLAHPSPVQRHSRPTILHVTICLAERTDLLANHAVHTALRAAWSRTRQWRVGYHLVMPDHVHLFCGPGVDNPESVKSWLAYWKRLAGDELPALRSVWQPDGWDTQMRTQEQYLRKLGYVGQNPVRKGLVARNEDWPYQGKTNELVWISR